MELTLAHIEHKIYTIRGVQAMLDSDLADLYHTETKFINRAVKRNSNRFPSDFAFQFTLEEWDSLRCQFGTFKKSWKVAASKIHSNSFYRARRGYAFGCSFF